MTTRIWAAAKSLRDLNDRRGQALVDGVLEVVDRIKPLHLSIVGGDPLVRFRELEQLIPLLRGAESTCRWSPARSGRWDRRGRVNERLHVAVSIDGLQPEHDVRRAPATYERILKNIVGQQCDDSLHGYRSDDEAAGIPGGVPGILDAAAGDQESVVQHVHAPSGRPDAGNSRAEPSERRPLRTCWNCERNFRNWICRRQ